MHRSRRRVGLCLQSSGAFAQNLLRGLRLYEPEPPGWYITMLEPRDLMQAGRSRCWRGDGLIYAAIDRKLVDHVAALGVPAVNVVDRTTPLPDSSVISDEQEIGRIAADHLLDKGFDHLAFTGTPTLRYSREREQGFVERVEQAGRTCHIQPDVLEMVRERYGARVARLSRWLESLPKPVGILAYNDGRAHRVVTTAAMIALRVPDQVAVLGVGNDRPLCELTYPPLSSVDTNLPGRATSAGEVLDELMRSGPATSNGAITRVPPTGIMPRLSTDTVAVPDPDVAEAERYIRLHAGEGITAQDVADHVSSSRRSLERRYSKHLGRGVGESLSAARRSIARRLLRETDMPILQIALSSGFASAASFATTFRRHQGLSPREYRKTQR
ncbi:MAG: XylR family transcriptional regulator [Phycisphaerae bacterium]